MAATAVVTSMAEVEAVKVDTAVVAKTNSAAKTDLVDLAVQSTVVVAMMSLAAKAVPNMEVSLEVMEASLADSEVNLDVTTVVTMSQAMMTAVRN